MQTVSLPFLGQPTIRVRRVPAVDRPLVVLQDVFTKLGGVSAGNVARRITNARENIGREVTVHTVREAGHDLLVTTLSDAIDLLVEVKVPAAKHLRKQLIELGKMVASGDEHGTVAAEIQANKEWLEAMPFDQQQLFRELAQPEVMHFGVTISTRPQGRVVSEQSPLKVSPL